MTNDARIALASKYRTVFLLNATGSEVLQDLERLFAQPPVLDGTADGMLLTYVRSAQRAVLDHIHARIQIAEEGDPRETPQASTGEAP